MNCVIKKLGCILLTLITLALLSSPIRAASPRLLIAEIRFTAGSDSSSTVSLVNITDTSISLDGWALEFANADFPATACESASWSAQNPAGSGVTTLLSGEVASQQLASFVLPIAANQAGSLRLISNYETDTSIQNDLVGYGATAPCYEVESAAQSSDNQRLVRSLDCQNLPIDTNTNQSDFTAIALDADVPSSCNNEDLASCKMAEISEVLPTNLGSNPADQKEFIELYNPTNLPIDLFGCSLYTSSASSKKLIFDQADILPSGGYLAVYGLTILDTGGEVRLTLNAGDQTIRSLTYENMSGTNKGLSLALFSDGWQLTSQLTPGAMNVLVEPAETELDEPTATESGLAPCGEGKYRNPDTNRCKSFEMATADLVPCDPGEIRNPETNRCRNATAAIANLVPCEAGEARNLATNRCRKITATSATLAACAEGSERNPETNRCRKIAAVTDLSGTKADPTTNAAVGNKLDLRIVGLVLLAAGAYGLYEYRSDARLWLTRLRQRFSGQANAPPT